MEQRVINQPTDGNNIRLHEGDRVYTHDTVNGVVKRFYGTIYLNDHKEVSEWAVKYDDGNDCAVLDFGQIFKAM